MNGSDLIRPLILQDAYPPEYGPAALREAAELMVQAEKPDAPRCHWEIYQVQRGVMIGAIRNECLPSVHRVIRAIEDRVGYKCNSEKSSVRLQNSVEDWPCLKWHQDYAGMGMNDGQDGVVAWVPLHNIDGTRPSIEFVDMPIDGALMHHLDSTTEFLNADGISADCATTPITDLKVGGAVFFSPFTVHRTYSRPQMRNLRISMDLRFYE